MKNLQVLFLVFGLTQIVKAEIMTVFQSPYIIGVGSSTTFAWDSPILSVGDKKVITPVSAITKGLKKKLGKQMRHLWSESTVDQMLYRVATEAIKIWQRPHSDHLLEVLIKDQGMPALLFRTTKIGSSEKTLMHFSGDLSQYTQIIDKAHTKPILWEKQRQLLKLQKYFAMFAGEVLMNDFETRTDGDNDLFEIIDLVNEETYRIYVVDDPIYSYKGLERFLDVRSLVNAPDPTDLDTPLTLEQQKLMEPIFGAFRSLFHNHRVHPFANKEIFTLSYPQQLVVENAYRKLMDFDPKTINIAERTQLIQAATGTGKSIMIGEIIYRFVTEWLEEYLQKKKPGALRNFNQGLYKPRVLFISHYNGVIEQLYFSLRDYLTKTRHLYTPEQWNEISYLYDGRSFSEKLSSKADFIFASPGTLGSKNRGANFLSTLQFDIVIADEGHHNGTETFEKMFDKIRNFSIWINATATPFDQNASLVVGNIGESIVNLPSAEAFRLGYVSPPHQALFWSRGALVDYASDYFDLIKTKTNTRSIAKNIIETSRSADNLKTISLEVAAAGVKLIANDPEQPTVAFVPSVDAAYELSSLINSLGVAADVYVSRKASKEFGVEPIGAEERRKILGDFRSGKTKTLIFVNIIEGLDFPFVNRLITFTGGSFRPTIQKLGRSFRSQVGKKLIIHFLNPNSQTFSAFLARGPQYPERQEVEIEIDATYNAPALEIPFVFGSGYMLGQQLRQKASRFHMKRKPKVILIDSGE